MTKYNGENSMVIGLDKAIDDYYKEEDVLEETGCELMETLTKALAGPAHEKLVVLDYLSKRLDDLQGELKAELLKEMDGSYQLQAWDTHLVSKVKLPMKWEYPSPLHSKIVADIEERKKQLKEMEKEMQKNGQAVAQGEQEYTIRVTEIKMTKEGK